MIQFYVQKTAIYLKNCFCHLIYKKFSILWTESKVSFSVPGMEKLGKPDFQGWKIVYHFLPSHSFSIPGMETLVHPLEGNTFSPLAPYIS